MSQSDASYWFFMMFLPSIKTRNHAAPSLTSDIDNKALLNLPAMIGCAGCHTSCEVNCHE